MPIIKTMTTTNKTVRETSKDGRDVVVGDRFWQWRKVNTIIGFVTQERADSMGPARTAITDTGNDITVFDNEQFAVML